MPTAEFAHNQKTHSTTRQSQFFLMMGYEPQAIPTAFPKTNVPSVEQRILNLQKARDEAIAVHDLARQKMAERTTQGFTLFKKGDKVWLEGTNLQIRYQSRKFTPKREGPFEIQDVLGPVTYRLKLPHQWKIHLVFHAALLTPYKENDTHGPNFTEPPPDLIDQEEQYKMDGIINHQSRGRGFQYLVKWKGYSSAHNTWEPEDNLKGSKETLQKYKKQHRL
jgi:hypothetical protein